MAYVKVNKSRWGGWALRCAKCADIVWDYDEWPNAFTDGLAHAEWHAARIRKAVGR